MIDKNGKNLLIGDEVRVEFMHDRKRKTVIGAEGKFILVETRDAIHGCFPKELTFIRRP